MGVRLGEARTTSAPSPIRICLGPNSSHSSKPSVAMITIRLPASLLINRSGTATGAGHWRARLRHRRDTEPGISRKRIGRAWGYLDAEGTRITARDEMDRLNAIGLPPGYEQGWFCAEPNGHLHATG